jgi:hypothetical protein
MDGLFALGVPPHRYRLPHPRLGLPVILLVRRVLLSAFEILRKRSGSLAGCKEDEITTALRAIIENDLRQSGSVQGFSRRTFETVVRQGQVVNFDLTKHSKTPDLCFKLRDDGEEPRAVLSEQDALFVECKPIDKTHAAGSKYCDLGVSRFVDGDYAWAMEEGLMLGYVRHGRTIAKHLLPAMKGGGRSERLQVVEAPRVVARSGAKARVDAEALHVSRHRRGFSWVEGKGNATEILIYHSWHDCEGAV